MIPHMIRIKHLHHRRPSTPSLHISRNPLTHILLKCVNPAVDAGFADMCGDAAWDAFDGMKLASPMTTSVPSQPEHDMIMNDLLNLDGLTDSGHNLDINWDPKSMNFGLVPIQDLPDFMDSSFDTSQFVFDEPKLGVESLTAPLFSGTQAISW